MKRREFLKTGALVVAGTAAAASGLIGVVGAEEPASKLAVLKPHEAETLLKISRHIFPHKNLGDGAYLTVVEDLDAAGHADPATAKLLSDGIAQLDSSQGKKFSELGEAEQIEALKSIQKTPFFQQIRTIELASLYSQPSVWKAFGYQGPAYKSGGYIHHGFDDLAWLPDPPLAASPKPA